MEESNNIKYFTPDIEDIRVGYECEWLRPDKLKETWYPIKMNLGYIQTAIEHGIEFFRVPYLTKEQIEAEGWKQLENKSPFTGKLYKWRKSFEDGFNNWRIYTLEFDIVPRIQIHLQTETSWQNENKYIYSGECKDINTFRYISKLLNIK